MGNWFGLVGPAGLPPEISHRADAAVPRRHGGAGDRSALATRGMAAIPQDAAGFTAHIRRDRDRWGRVVAAGQYPGRMTRTS